MKAFLSHSSKDKSLVEAVGKQLGRQFCLYDRFDFSTGDDFKVAIQRCLDQAALFVLFASEDSLKSIWVNFEIEEAWHRKLREQVSKSLVYIIDDDVQPIDLPEWLQRALVRRDSVAASIGRDIRSHIDELLQSRRHPYFVGRSADISRLEEILTPTDGSASPHMFVTCGLPGVGRRTLIRHAVSNVLGFRKFIEIRFEEGDSINDVCAKTADIVEPYSNRTEFTRLFEQIRDLVPSEALLRTLNNLRALCEGGELPIFVDDGGLLDNEGYIRAPALDLLRAVTPNDTAYLAFVSYRRPQRQSNLVIPVLQVNPLSESDTKRLVQRLCDIHEIRIPPSELADIAEYVAGYPPSAYFATQQAKDYGIDLVVRHKQRLVEFRSGVFLKHIEGLRLQTSEGSALQLLATFSPIPLPAIVSALGIALEELDHVLTRLIDLSLVIPDGDGLYRIAEPIKEAATSTYGFPRPDQCARVAEALESYLESDVLPHRHLELSRVLFRSARFGGTSDVAKKGIHLASDLIRLTEDYYHARDYERSVKYGDLAVKERPDSLTARSYLIRSLIQQEQWGTAEHQLKELARFAPGRDVHFLRGFLERRRGDFKRAIDEYEEARRLGRKGAAIGRELAQSYFMVGNVEAANRYLQEALERHGDNRYVVDLWVQIATQLGDREEAGRALERLELIDQPVFFLYRKSRIEWRFGNTLKARDAVRDALALESKPPFAFIAQAALCEITLHNLDEAERLLSILDTGFGDVRRDVRTGLRCRLQIARTQYVDALSLSDRIVDKSSRYYQIIRYQALRGILETAGSISQEKRMTYEEEFRHLEQGLGPDPVFDLPELDRRST